MLTCLGVTHERWHKEPCAVPVAQLIDRYAGKTLNVLFAERRYDVAGAHAVAILSLVRVGVHP